MGKKPPMMTGLFGDKLPAWDVEPEGITGYADLPGSGPAGATCGKCESFCRLHYNDRRYYKCVYQKDLWIYGHKTDIKYWSAACSKFKEGKNGPV